MKPVLSGNVGSSSKEKVVDRKEVERRARIAIKRIKQEIKELMKGCEHETLFHLVALLPNIFAELSKKQVTQEKIYVKPSWFRCMIATSLALNELLPDYLPLKTPSMFSLDAFNESFERLIKIALKFFNLAWWIFIRDNKYIDRIVVDREFKPAPYFSEKNKDAITSYINALYQRREDYLNWLIWQYHHLCHHTELLEAIDNYLDSNHGFRLEDLGNASEYLKSFYEKCVKEEESPIISRNELHKVFAKNLRDARAHKLLKALVFNENDENRDLLRAPLIPLRGGDLLIAGFVFNPYIHFDAWISYIMERDPKVRDVYANVVGDEFEKYVISILCKSGIAKIYPKVIISESKFPEMRECLKRLKKERQFEIDIVAVTDNSIYLISCKGGKKEIPKAYISRYWLFPTEKEIIRRIDENLHEVDEIVEEASCLEKHKAVVRQLFGVTAERITPVIVYAQIQPLAISEFRRKFNVPDDLIIATPSSLPQLLNYNIRTHVPSANVLKP